MYITVDLKVVEGLADAVGRAAGADGTMVLGGLVRLWHRCWADEVDQLGRSELAGIFGGKGLDEVIVALEAFGFLEPKEGSVWRIRGASRYLRLRESRRRGAALTNASKSRSKSDALERRLSGATPHAQARSLTESPSHRVTEHRVTEVATPVPTETDGVRVVGEWTSAQDFWNWFQALRRKAGCVRETTPADNALKDFWRDALMELNGDPEPLREAVFRYGDDKFWQSKTPPCPFMGFARNWTKYVPRGAVANDA